MHLLGYDWTGALKLVLLYDSFILGKGSLKLFLLLVSNEDIGLVVFVGLTSLYNITLKILRNHNYTE